MISEDKLGLIGLYVEGFFFGKISVLCQCALTCTLAKEVHLFLGLGIYTGIFAMYLLCPLKESRTAIIVFYVLCLLYVLSMATVVIDLLEVILEVSNNSICKIIIMQMCIDALSPQIQKRSQSMIFLINIVQVIANGSCDFIAQGILVRINHLVYHPFYSLKSSKIFRCWIVWGKDIRVVIIPSFLAIAFIGQYIYLHSLS
jgi:hypothetical protein